MKQFVNFLGVGIDVITFEDMFTQINAWVGNKSSRSHHIAIINAYCSVLASKNERLLKIYNGADIVGPDGVPFAKWMRRVTRKPVDQFSGHDVILRLINESKTTGYTFYLYGGAPDVLKTMKENLELEFAFLKIVGLHSPPFRALTREEDDAVCEEINRLRPDIVLVGLGTPKQDYWIDAHLHRIRGSVLINIGAAFDFFGGRVKMAPLYIQRSGFEWLYRLLGKDILRLWKRYTIYNMIFFWRFFLQLTKIRCREPKRWSRTDEGRP